MNMLTVMPLPIILKLLFTGKNKKKNESQGDSKNRSNVDIVKSLAGYILTFLYLGGLIFVTMTVNFNLDLGASNTICYTTSYSFINDMTFTQVLTASFQYIIIRLVLSDCMKNYKRERKLLMKIINEEAMTLFRE